MSVYIGEIPIALRQASSAAFTGVTPKNAGAVEFSPRVDAVTGIAQYANPNDPAEVALAEGGKFDFEGQTVKVKEIRAASLNGNISVVVGDRGDTAHDVTCATPATSRIVFDPPLMVLSSQILKVSTAAGGAGGFVDVYVVKGAWF